MYSAFKDLASIIDLSGVWGEVLLMMLRAVFDAGGTDHDQPCLVVAGFISSADDWEKFDAMWKARLAADGIDHFHMVDFAHFKGQFEGWTEERRQSILGDLVDIIHAHAYRKFGSIVVNKNLSLVSESLRDEFRLRAYSLAGRTCAARVRQWVQFERIAAPIAYVFEEGDLGKGDLVTRFIGDDLSAPIFKPKKDRESPDGTVVHGFSPLQAADILAYEYFTVAARVERGNEFDPEKARWALKEFEKMPGEVGIYTPDSLKESEKLLKLHKELEDWVGGLSKE
jgi:hypothetical protein